MIWDPAHSQEKRAARAVMDAAYAAGGASGDGILLDGARMSELAEAVQCFLETDGSGETMDAEHAVLLAAHALATTGEAHAGRKLLVLGSGLVEPSEWDVTGGEAVWAVDLQRMTMRSDAVLELVFYGALRLVVEAMADLWDATAGRGVLGLRNVCRTACGMLQGGRSPADLNAVTGEIKALCQDVLRRQAGQRGWDNVPRVLALGF